LLIERAQAGVSERFHVKRWLTGAADQRARAGFPRIVEGFT
jgi:hypothetical protein